MWLKGFTFVPSMVLLAASLPVNSQEPTSEELWREQPPPFRTIVEGVAAPVKKGAQFKRIRDDAPWLLPPIGSDPQRALALSEAASHASRRYAALGLRAPRVSRRDGVFPIYFVRRLGGGRSAQYGPGFGEFGREESRRVDQGDWDRVLIVDEHTGFGSDLAIYPEKVAASLAHEIFHGVQASYAPWSVHDPSADHEGKWISEGLPDALGLWAIEGLPFLDQPPFDARRRFASGSPRFGKALGMRPYDYPLDMRRPAPNFPLAPASSTPQSRRTLMAYMSSSFWTHAWQHSMPRGQAWKPLPRALLLRTPLQGSSSLQDDALAWADRSLRENHPAWTRGLYDALPAFIPWWVAYPDEVMRSRRGEFAHARWLGHAFVDGCPLHELNEASPTATFTISIRELAATCVRVKWTGAPSGRSGWPAAALVVVPGDGGGEAALSDLHLGMHGSKLGKTDPFTDPRSGLPGLAWSGLSLDPRHPDKTDGETVITFTNVAREPDQSRRRVYEVHLGMAIAAVSGELEKPAEPRARPASKVRVASPPRALPTQVIATPPGKSLSMAMTAPAAGKDDCNNATAKSAGLVAIGMDKTATAAGAPNLMSICLDVTANATRSSLRPARQPEVSLKLPSVPDGHTGPIRGGRVIVTWTDPALGERGKQHVDARTRDVDISIAQANPAFVRGRFTARFSAPADGANGMLSGDFVAWRVPTEDRLPLADAIDYASSDLLLAFAATGRSPDQMRSQLERRTASRGGAASARAPAEAGPCPMDCESLRRGKVSAQCRALAAPVYEACQDGAATGREEVRELAAWLYRQAPEAMRPDLIEQTVESMMALPSALREDWVRKTRARRDAAKD